MKIIARTLLLSLIVFSFTVPASALNFFVTDEFDSPDLIAGNGVCADIVGACSLRAAITEANASAGDDTIFLLTGTYTQTLIAADEDNNAGGDWDIRSNITIIGDGAATTVIQANAAADTASERVLHSVLDTNIVTITGVTIRHGKKGGAVNETNFGGGIFNNGSDLTLNDSIVTQNRSAGGGGIFNKGNLTLGNTTISGNRCDEGTSPTCAGGGIFSVLTSTRNITITGSTFTDNIAKGNDGFMAYGFGAGMAVQSSIATGVNLNISNSSFTDNQCVGVGFDPGVGGGGGGAIWLNTQGSSVMNISNTTISGNQVTGGHSGRGAGIMIISMGGFSGTWDKVTVADNTGNSFGIGISINATGGGITFNVTDSTISGNIGSSASSGGGGIFLTAASHSNAIVTMNFLNSTISGNQAAFGGGLYMSGPEGNAFLTANFNFCTIAGNNATSAGGGIYRGNTPGGVNLKNTIISGNTATGNGKDALGILTSQDYNHIKNLNGPVFTPMPHDTSGFDPQLGPLQDNGGPTLTQMLAATSPLVNVIPDGTNGCGAGPGGVTTDQRGFARPSMSRCEPGSTEVQSFPGGPFSVSGTVMTEGGIPIRNVTVVLSGGGLSEPRFTVTGSLGNYIFTNVPANAYTVSISSKKFFFAEDGKFINVASDRTDVNFSGTPATSRGILKNIEK